MGVLSNLFKLLFQARSPRLKGPGKFNIDVVGESYYQDNFRELFRQSRRSDMDGESFSDAELILDDANPHDRQAVAVLINGQRVGHLSRAMARDFRAALKRDGLNGFTRFTVGARVYHGGHDELWSVSVDLPQT